MIVGIGIDIVACDRLKSWLECGDAQLQKVFTQQELEYCRHDGELNVQALAARFAAKEAFFKALSAVLVRLQLTNQEFSFLWACKQIEVIKGIWDEPIINVDWRAMSAGPMQADAKLLAFAGNFGGAEFQNFSEPRRHRLIPRRFRNIQRI